MKLHREMNRLGVFIGLAALIFVPVSPQSSVASPQKSPKQPANQKSGYDKTGKPSTTGQNKSADSQAAPDPKPQTDNADDAEFTCAMHPEVRSKTKGKCPKCGMALVSINPAVIDDF